MTGTARKRNDPADGRCPDDEPGPIPQDPDPVAVAAVQRRTVRVLMAAQIIGGIGMGSMLSSGSLLTGRLTGSEAAAGLATTFITFGAALLGIPLAALSRTRGRRAGLSAGWLLGAVGSLVVMSAAWLGQALPVFPGMLLIGAATAANLQSRYAAADLADDAHRARDLSLVVWSTTAGSVLGPNLSGPGEPVARALGLPEEAGTFVFSVAAFLIGCVMIRALLRPDPLLLAASVTGRTAAPGTGPTPRFTARLTSALRHVRGVPEARLGLVALVLGHAAMVSVMTMTPLHLAHHGAELSVVGFTISLHIAGMYAFSPLVGRLADRLGRIRVVLVGQAVLLCAVAVAGIAGDSQAATVTALFLLGLGWSCATVAGSTLLTESTAAAHRSDVQGVADTVMNLAGAGGGVLAGGIVALIGYGGLNAAVVLLILPVAVLALAPRPRS